MINVSKTDDLLGEVCILTQNENDTLLDDLPTEKRNQKNLKRKYMGL